MLKHRHTSSPQGASACCAYWRRRCSTDGSVLATCSGVGSALLSGQKDLEMFDSATELQPYWEIGSLHVSCLSRSTRLEASAYSLK